MTNLTDTAVWRALAEHHPRVAPMHMRGLFERDPGRFERFSLRACGILLDYSRNRATDETMRPAGTIFARYVVDEEGGDEERFVERVVSELRARSVAARKLLCGRSHRIGTAHGAQTTRSLLIADLGRDESLMLQCRGIGPGRLLGCGLFVPHKDVGPVRPMADEG